MGHIISKHVFGVGDKGAVQGHCFFLCSQNFKILASGCSLEDMCSHRNSKTQFHDFSMINNVISMTI